MFGLVMNDESKVEALKKLIEGYDFFTHWSSPDGFGCGTGYFMARDKHFNWRSFYFKKGFVTDIHFSTDTAYSYNRYVNDEDWHKVEHEKVIELALKAGFNKFN